MTTAPLPTASPHRGAAHRQRSRSAGLGVRRLLRGLSGALAAGLVVLTLVLAVAQWLSPSATVPGPGAATIVGHGVGAVVALLAQAVADRSRGGRAVAASVVVLAVVVMVLWLGWWR
ncbi:MAG: hypothetical protein M3R63_22995 [Actinomycetota bacterium]|nr:hypothetical protein [Actinomycetota bacterium]